mmetsp:Transcript_76099/g.236211  ORF Transcript_76099/g.236211 Transcript_76099/m.236211 type:complete len:350 (-) Transcript_76099:65-1114(-)
MVGGSRAAALAVLLQGAAGIRVASRQDPAGSTSPCNGVGGSWVRIADPVKNPPVYYNATALREAAGDAQRDFTPTAEEPYLPATLWDWVPFDSNCSFVKMQRATFCSAMERYGLRRLFVVGDSISYMMVQSLWKLVDGEGDVGSQVSWDMWKGKTISVDKQIACPAGDVQLRFVRNDRLTKTTYFQDCGDYCFPWWDEYVQSKQPTLLLVNTGLHRHVFKEFQGDVSTFLSQMVNTTEQRPGDKVVYRLGLPGHESCWDHKEPFKSKDEFKLGFLAEVYAWKFAPDQNKYVKNVARNKRQTTKLNVRILDVYDMTIQRPDGHRGSDCLHYYLPGVVDWWNHLLVTELLA